MSSTGLLLLLVLLLRSSLPPQVAVQQDEMFDNRSPLHIVSWNACGVTSFDKQAALQAYVLRHHPQVVFIQEAFIGHRDRPDAPSLPGYVSYVHRVRNSLISYLHSSLPHKLLRCSTDDHTTYQLFEVTRGTGTLHLCNVYCLPLGLSPAALPPPAVQGMIYMGDFNARHPEMSDVSPTPNRNGRLLLQFIKANHLTRWATGGATHTRGGTLDHVITSGLVAAHVTCSSVPALFSDHVALSFKYSLPIQSSSVHHRLRISIPPKYYPSYVAYMSACLTQFHLQSPASLYSSLVTLTHDFFTRYVSRPHIKRSRGSVSWTIDDRVLLAERTAVEDGRLFQLDPTPDNLRRYQSSRDALVALQGSVRTDSWHRFTDSINQGTSVGTMWRLRS